MSDEISIAVSARSDGAVPMISISTRRPRRSGRDPSGRVPADGAGTRRAAMRKDPEPAKR